MLFLSQMLPTGAFCQKNQADTTKTNPEWVKKLTEITDVYGSLRFKAGVTVNGTIGISDQASRIGIKGRIPIAKGIDAVAQFEPGINLVGTKTKIRFNGDPGGAVGEVDNVFTSRLGWVGVDTKYGQITWGKQWSVYYDVAGWTDYFNAFGGEASGTYSAGTDGSTSGSGRAANAFQYRLDLTFLSINLQVQNRNISDSARGYADTFGGSLIINSGIGLKMGIAYDMVRDGILKPEIGQPKYGDESAVAGLVYTDDHFYVSATGCSFTNHETDNLGNYFSGKGFEFFGQYSFPKRWAIYGGFNYLKPDNEDVAWSYQIKYFDVGSSYGFGKSSIVFIEAKIEDSKNHDGTKSNSSVFGFGMYFNFGN
jgi:predicted porin